jgi:hypothetical protein
MLKEIKVVKKKTYEGFLNNLDILPFTKKNSLKIEHGNK